MHTCTHGTWQMHRIKILFQMYVCCGSVNKQYIKHFNGWKFTAIVLFTFKCSQYCLHSNVVFAIAYINANVFANVKYVSTQALPYAHRIPYPFPIYYSACFHSSWKHISSAIDDCHIYHHFIEKNLRGTRIHAVWPVYLSKMYEFKCKWFWLLLFLFCELYACGLIEWIDE